MDDKPTDPCFNSSMNERSARGYHQPQLLEGMELKASSPLRKTKTERGRGVISSLFTSQLAFLLHWFVFGSWKAMFVIQYENRSLWLQNRGGLESRINHKNLIRNQINVPWICSFSMQLSKMRWTVESTLFLAQQPHSFCLCHCLNLVWVHPKELLSKTCCAFSQIRQSFKLLYESRSQSLRFGMSS